MNRKQLAILLVLVVVVGGAGLLTWKKQKAAQSSGNAGVGKKLLPDFPVNDVAHISIRQGSDAVSLVKKDDVWKVAERHDYPANFSSISEFLLKLRDLKAGQVEQAGPSQMPRLQLAANGQGTNAPLADNIDIKKVRQLLATGVSPDVLTRAMDGSYRDQIELRLVTQGRQKEVRSFSGKGQRRGCAKVPQGICHKNGFAF
jgi:hypothetical protein